ncbi:hypothetical protein OE88DRAFT_1739412 [Heliocybe sulcata]|uniref:Uncharacterized protein n=1 Tax=Heliocybe sulcata TaxID=5364 RepID=A0A5C3MP27_9AGAM|nr:hypothetical protein OE88DRAFT_1739412 [Heliocybe sulcata]
MARLSDSLAVLGHARTSARLGASALRANIYATMAAFTALAPRLLLHLSSRRRHGPEHLCMDCPRECPGVNAQKDARRGDDITSQESVRLRAETYSQVGKDTSALNADYNRLVPSTPAPPGGPVNQGNGEDRSKPLRFADDPLDRIIERAVERGVEEALKRIQPAESRRTHNRGRSLRPANAAKLVLEQEKARETKDERTAFLREVRSMFKAEFHTEHDDDFVNAAPACSYDIADFKDGIGHGPQEDNLKWDLQGASDSPWNKAVFSILLQKLRSLLRDAELPERSDAYLLDMINTKFLHIRAVWRTAQPAPSESETHLEMRVLARKKAELERARRNTRHLEKYHRREGLLRQLIEEKASSREPDIKGWKWLHELVMNLTEMGMSSEESDDENGVAVFRVRALPWRRDIEKELSLKRGAKPAKRVWGTHLLSSRPPAVGLPRALYRDEWWNEREDNYRRLTLGVPEKDFMWMNLAWSRVPGRSTRYLVAKSAAGKLELVVGWELASQVGAVDIRGSMVSTTCEARCIRTDHLNGQAIQQSCSVASCSYVRKASANIYATMAAFTALAPHLLLRPSSRRRHGPEHLRMDCPRECPGVNAVRSRSCEQRLAPPAHSTIGLDVDNSSRLSTSTSSKRGRKALSPLPPARFEVLPGFLTQSALRRPRLSPLRSRLARLRPVRQCIYSSRSRERWLAVRRPSTTTLGIDVRYARLRGLVSSSTHPLLCLAYAILMHADSSTPGAAYLDWLVSSLSDNVHIDRIPASSGSQSLSL